MHTLKTSLLLAFDLLLALNVLAQEGYIDAEGNSRLHYRIVGTGKDTLVVADVGWQYPYYEKHGQGLLYIIYDVRNRAYSDASERVGINQDVEDLETVRKFFKIKRLNVLGWSYYGGMVALYAGAYSEFTRSIIQVGPITIEKNQHFDEYMKSFGDRRSKELDQELEVLKSDGVDTLQREAYCRKFFEASIHAFIYRTNTAHELSSLVPCDCANEQPDNFQLLVQRVFGKLGDWNWTMQAKTIRARSLIIHGMADNIPLESSQLWASSIKNSQLITFKKSGHMPFAEEPELYFQSIRKFVSKLRSK